MKKIIIISLILAISFGLFAQVAINTDGTQANSSAILDVKSTSMGLLLPRMTSGERDLISSPAEGLIIYCIDCISLQLFNGTDWIDVGVLPNQAPVANNVYFTGSLAVGQLLTGMYNYSDNEADIEGASLYQWYRADDTMGTNQIAISGATSITYFLVAADANKYLSFIVTPEALTGTSPGSTVWSVYQGSVTNWNCGDPLFDSRDGSTYATVLTGTQCWMAENLNIGITINSFIDQVDNGTIEKYCYNNNLSDCDTWGGLYQWDEMMEYTTTSGTQGICPSGWHLPADMEWCTLENENDIGTIVCNANGLKGIDAGGNLKETGTTHWNAPNTGATNSSGFTSIGSGFRNLTGGFTGRGGYAIFFSSTNYNSSSAIGHYTTNNTAQITRDVENKKYGFSVRCIKN